MTTTYDPARPRKRLRALVQQAWCAYDRAGGLQSAGGRPVRWGPAPIVFFGDLDAYRKSPLQVLTVGLNPSWNEFPPEPDEPFRRFPLMKGSGKRETDRYLAALSAYFCTDPYKDWFNRGFEKVLNGAGSSYYGGFETSTALHTDICSPVATDPTWSELEKEKRKAECEYLMADGGRLWHMLLEVLQPKVVVLSVAEKHFKRIKFVPMTECETIHTTFERADGRCRSRPYEVRSRWYEVGGDRSLFVFGEGSRKPFMVPAAEKLKVGAAALKTYRDGR